MESEVAEKCSWDQENREEKLGLVWRNRKKTSKITVLPINYFMS